MQKPVFNKVKPFPPIKPEKSIYKQELISDLTSFSDLKEFVSKLEKEYPKIEGLHIGCDCSGNYDHYCDSLSDRFLCFYIENENFEEQNEQYLKDYKKYQTELKAYNKALKEFGIKNNEYKKFKKESKLSLKEENKKLKELLEQVKSNPNFDKSVLDKV
jgi:hypothetical protein